MKLHVDKAGRVVVPKPLRKRLGIEHESEVEAIEQPNGILLRPIRETPSMVQVDGLWVHQGVPEPGCDWERVVDDVREERIKDVLNPR